jgi:predicted transcriptional regulator
VSKRPSSKAPSAKWNLDVKPLTDAERRASERVARSILGNAAGSVAATPDTAAAPDSALPPGSVDTPSTVSAAPDSAATPDSAAIIVPGVAGETRVSNTVLDSLLERLHPHDQLVYLRLYRLSYGHRRDWCRVGFDKLAAKTNLNRTAVIRSVARLEALGLVEREAADQRAPRSERGNRYVVRPPVESSRAATPRSAAALGSAAARMKENMKESHESALSPEEVDAISAAESHKRAMERVPGHRENMRARFGERMPWEPGYIPLSRRAT